MPDAASTTVIARNRRYWEALAADRPGQPVEFFRSGGSALEEHELAAAGDVRGCRVLQLACSVGDEALTFAMSGAYVTAVDIAPSHLATGRSKAEALGLRVDFREADMMSLPPTVTGFDLVYVGGGGICWVPDIDAWARLVAERLNPGGRLLISEHHPLWEVLTVVPDERLAVSGSYFEPARDGYADPDKAPQVTRYVGAPAVVPRSYVWNLGALVGAVLAAGMTVRALRESSEPDMYQGLGARGADIPATYLLVAAR